jgi:hypothetical protein
VCAARSSNILLLVSCKKLRLPESSRILQECKLHLIGSFILRRTSLSSLAGKIMSCKCVRHNMISVRDDTASVGRNRILYGKTSCCNRTSCEITLNSVLKGSGHTCAYLEIHMCAVFVHWLWVVEPWAVILAISVPKNSTVLMSDIRKYINATTVHLLNMQGLKQQQRRPPEQAAIG